MNFSTHQDVDAPIQYVFQRVSNFGAYERQALRQGAHVARVDGSGPVRVGSAWNVDFTFRGKDRKLRAEISRLDAPTSLQVVTEASGLGSETTVVLVPLSPNTTRVNVTIDLMAKSMRARVMLQSLKLAKSNLNRRFAKRVREQVSGIAGDYKRGV